jgi:hypothetical protein
MINSDIDIKRFLEERGIKHIAAIVRDFSDPKHFFVQLHITEETSNQTPSGLRLRRLQEEFVAQDIKIDFVIIDDNAASLEAGLRASLMAVYIELLRNVFCSIDRKQARVWMETKKTIPDAARAEIEDHVQKYFKVSNTEVVSIVSVSDQNNLPSNLVLLKAIRQLAPVTPEHLSAHLLEREFQIPSLVWLVHKCDVLRKQKLLIRTASGKFVLTFSALEKLGSGKRRTSPDIVRLLALARRTS